MTDDAPTLRSLLDREVSLEPLQQLAKRLRPLRYVPIIVLTSAYVIWFSALSLHYYANYQYPPFDLAIFDQSLWLLSHLRDPFVTIMGLNVFGDHQSFILLLMAPFYRLAPEPQGILIFQTLALALPVLPLYWSAKRLMHSDLIATCFAGTYLLNPVIQQVNLEQFHPECVLPALLAFALYFTIRWRPWWLLAMVFLALITKEDSAAFIVPLGIFVGWRQSWRIGSVVMAAGVAWTVLANYFISHWLVGENIYAARIPFGGLSGSLSELVHHLSTFWGYLHSQGRPFYLWLMVAFAGVVCVLAPEAWLLAGPKLAENVFSNDSYQHQYIYHYSLGIVVTLLVGSMLAVLRFRNVVARYVLALAVLSVAAYSCVGYGLTPFSNAQPAANWNANITQSAAVDTLVSRIPPNAIVSSWYTVLPHLARRPQAYLWPSPFSTQYWGDGHHEGLRLSVAARTKYLVLPESPSSMGITQSVWASVRPHYIAIATAGGYTLYRRR